ncbi:hypothetical protein JWJ90_10820 [Desulfobulbus rhabdoformis]|uniref:hypothetical protein n=1 Tax=Desulfobulbus rhabdoformis TaxID=34032 RepID=UPI00196325EB|nr:hypothetical protein [Desulfobulbus rhabdoformis]MBM9614776.1 hypothetical protein [Desulfobulbus rhabdoformis]
MNKQRLVFTLLLSAFAFLALEKSSLAVNRMTDCDCYRYGVRSDGTAKTRPKGCRMHTMGPMTPWLGGYYDAQRGDYRYLNENNWCSPSNRRQQSHASTNRSGNGQSSSRPQHSSGNSYRSSSGSYHWVVADFYAQPTQLAYSWGCPNGYHYDQKHRGCVGGCRYPYKSFTTKHSAFCIQCPHGTNRNITTTDHRGIPVCAAR